MRKLIVKCLILLLFTIYFLPSTTLAAGNDCYKNSDCAPDEVCSPKSVTPATGTSPYLCVGIKSGPASVFGKINPPESIDKLGVGSIGISKFLNNLITLIYMIATVVFVFMMLFSGLEWILSGGDKDKVASAQKRITNALIGLAIFAVAFALLNVLGVFTGFTFFV